MWEFSAYVAFDKATNGQTDIKHEMGKPFSSMSLWKIVGEAKIEFGKQIKKTSLLKEIFVFDIELSVSPISCFISVCLFVALSKATHTENLLIVLSSRY